MVQMTAAQKKWLGILLGMLFTGSLFFQAWQLYRFVHQGPRFTAQDGEILCQRILALEQASYGYRDAGKTPAPCEYMRRK